MSDLDKVQQLLASAPDCRQRIEAIQAADGRCSAEAFRELAALWQAADGWMSPRTSM